METVHKGARIPTLALTPWNYAANHVHLASASSVVGQSAQHVF